MHAKALTAIAGIGLALALTGQALADSIPIKASYGDKAGCAYAKSGDSTGADVFFLLTKGEITTAASVCTFGDLVSTAPDKIVAKVSCQSEDDTGDDVATIVPVGKGYKITLQDGTVWGPLKRC